MNRITDKEFRQLADYIHSNFGIYLKTEKKALLLARLNNILAEKNFRSFSEYYDYIVNDKSGEAIATLTNKITTNHTYFMREADHFDYFKSTVLPYLKDTVKNKDLRIWSAGCSTGEEAYTLTMIMEDFFGQEKQYWDTRILATDISDKVLNIAKSGVYNKEKIASLPSLWIKKYFVKHDNNNYILKDNIKNEVILRKLNLMDDRYPFKKRFHTIFCRNVMIYFDNKTRYGLINKFYDFIEPGGYLFIGHSESLNREETKFKYVMPAIYRKML